MAVSVTTKWQLFPKHLFQHWVRLAFDLPCDNVNARAKLAAKQDDTGHHRATCASRHKVMETRSIVRGRDSRQHAGNSCHRLHYKGRTNSPSRRLRQAWRHLGRLQSCTLHLVLDYTLTHPRTGSSNKYPIGSWKPDALSNKKQQKDKKHASRLNTRSYH
jgi:hypothetical protein